MELTGGGSVLSYAFKRVIRSWKLFAALLLGVMLASTFFAGINIGADTAAKQALEQQLSQVPVDIVVDSPGLLSSANATEIASVISGSGIEGIAEVEVISRVYLAIVRLPEENKTTHFRAVGLSGNSHVYGGLTVISGASSLQVNETYVWIESPEAENLKLGDVLQMNFSVRTGTPPPPGGWGMVIAPENQVWGTLNLTVAGFVQLDDQANRIATGRYWYSPEWGPGLGPTPFITPRREYAFEGNLLIVNWEGTFAPLLDAIYALSPPSRPIHTEILGYLDRGSVISPWDIPGSIDGISAIESQIKNKVWSYNVWVTNYLSIVLNSYQFVAQTMRFSFLVTALPVFFMAWYMGTTVSDVSLNLRRREIGLLLTKGFSKGQLLRMFLGEAVLVGLIGGAFGIALSLLLNLLFAGVAGSVFSGAPVIGPDTIAITVVFSVIITFLSVFRPARRASGLDAVDALREYRYVEEVKPYKKRWPWIALILGTYKIVLWLLGINLYAMTMGPAPTRNILALILLGAWIFFDTYVLNYIGPILFFWGLTKILIRGSLKFQELTTKAAKFLGDLGSLATRNVQRNPARTASIAFLIALIMGYSFQVVGAHASERDYTIRQIRFSVGADISVSLTTLENASSTMDDIGSLPGVSSTVLEYTFHGESTVGGITLKAVDPEKWLETAHYEKELFAGNDVTTAFHQMKTDNNTIILERRIARALNLQVDQTIAITFGPETRSLEVVGFFGPEPRQAPSYYRYEAMPTWSYVPEGLYNAVKGSVTYVTGKILVKLEPGVDGKTLADQIQNLELNNVSVVYSVAEELQEWQTNILLSGPMNVQRLGIAFAVLVASVGAALVTLVSLKERSKEVSIMSVRGLSFKQLTMMLLTENVAVMVFSLLLGAVVGLIIVRGNVAAANTIYAYSILTRHMVFPMDSLLTLFACFILVFASTIIPVVVMARRYISRLERMVREA